MGNVYLGDKKVTSKGWYLGDAPLFDNGDKPIFIGDDGKEYYEKDCHIFIANSRAVNLPVPNDAAVIFVTVDGEKKNYATQVKGKTFNNSTIHAIFDWDSPGYPDYVHLDWLSDILQFGYNSGTGKRNQLKSATAAFNHMIANPAAIAKLDVSNLTDMEDMFYEASGFNSDISEWDTSKVTNMDHMFDSASSFNQDLSQWCVSLIDSEPSYFKAGSGFAYQPAKHPQWGKCPRGEDGS